jgi:hypothetical protein
MCIYGPLILKLILQKKHVFEDVNRMNIFQVRVYWQALAETMRSSRTSRVVRIGIKL